MVCYLPWSGASWFDIWTMERNGVAGKRPINWFQVVLSSCHPVCCSLFIFILSGMFPSLFIWLGWFYVMNRGAGFISLENLLFFAKTFSVRSQSHHLNKTLKLSEFLSACQNLLWFYEDYPLSSMIGLVYHLHLEWFTTSH